MKTLRSSIIAGMSLALVLLHVSAVGASAQDAGVEVSALTGSVEVRLSGEDDYAPAEEGMTLEAGDSVRSSSSGTAEISFNTDSTNIVRLSEDSELKLLLGEREKVELSQGELFASIAALEPGSSFEVRTPTAVSGARNTDWVTRVTDEGTEVEAVEHTPFVRHFEPSGVLSTEDTPVSSGQMTLVRKFQRPRPPAPIQARRLERWQQVKQRIRRNAAAHIERRRTRPKFNRQQFRLRARQMRAREIESRRKNGQVQSPPGKPGPVNPGQQPKRLIKPPHAPRTLDSGRAEREKKKKMEGRYGIRN